MQMTEEGMGSQKSTQEPNREEHWQRSRVRLRVGEAGEGLASGSGGARAGAEMRG